MAILAKNLFYTIALAILQLYLAVWTLILGLLLTILLFSAPYITEYFVDACNFFVKQDANGNASCSVNDLTGMMNYASVFLGVCLVTSIVGFLGLNRQWFCLTLLHAIISIVITSIVLECVCSIVSLSVVPYGWFLVTVDVSIISCSFYIAACVWYTEYWAIDVPTAPSMVELGMSVPHKPYREPAN